MKNVQQKILNKWIIIILIVVGAIVVSCYILNDQSSGPVTGAISNAISTSTTIQECLDTDFGTSNMYTATEKQRNCALLTLATAKSIEIDKQQIGDFYTLSDIKALATDSTTTSNSPADLESDKCWKNAGSNAAMDGCAYSGEKSLQDVIRSLVKMNIDKEKVVSGMTYDTDPAFYADQMKTEWQDWYVSITSDTSTVNAQCTLETDRDVFGGSITPLYKSGCFIKQDAIEILWLVDKLNEVRQDRTPQ
jgi:hypothetical protein